MSAGAVPLSLTRCVHCVLGGRTATQLAVSCVSCAVPLRITSCRLDSLCVSAFVQHSVPCEAGECGCILHFSCQLRSVWGKVGDSGALQRGPIPECMNGCSTGGMAPAEMVVLYVLAAVCSDHVAACHSWLRA